MRSDKRRVSLIGVLIVAFMLFAGLSLTGCTTRGVEKTPGRVEQTEPNQQISKNSSEVLETTLDLVDQGKTLEFNFRLINISDKSISLLFGSGHQYDIIVTDSRGQEVYNWAADKDFTQALIEKDLAPGKELSYVETWDYKGADGNSLPPGKYSLKVTIIATIENEEVKGEVKAEDFSAVKEFKIK